MLCHLALPLEARRTSVMLTGYAELFCCIYLFLYSTCLLEFVVDFCVFLNLAYFLKLEHISPTGNAFWVIIGWFPLLKAFMAQPH